MTVTILVYAYPLKIQHSLSTYNIVLVHVYIRQSLLNPYNSVANFSGKEQSGLDFKNWLGELNFQITIY